MKKVVLAYSGGLDTTLSIHWLHYNKGFEVITYSANLGQKTDLDEVSTRALSIGAATVHMGEVTDRFVNEFVLPALRAGAQHRGRAILSAALSRPLIAYEMVKIALDEGAEYLAHGGTPWGNDQIRFETVAATLAPNLKTIAPLREWQMTSRKQEIEYAKRHAIPIKVTKDSPYSTDQNIWGTTIECGDIDLAWSATPEEVFLITRNPAEAPDEPAVVEIGFDEGVPVQLDGRHLPAIKIIEELNAVGGLHGIGRGEAVEDRLLGYKAMKIQEAPAAEILFKAHAALEAITLSSELLGVMHEMSLQYADIIYHGTWFSDMRLALDAFFSNTQKYVTGAVKLRLYKGSADVIGRKSPHSLHDQSSCCIFDDIAYSRKAAEGFLEIRRMAVSREAERRKKEGRMEP